MQKRIAFFFILVFGAIIQSSCSSSSQNPKIKSINVTPDKVAANATIDIKNAISAMNSIIGRRRGISRPFVGSGNHR